MMLNKYRSHPEISFGPKAALLISTTKQNFEVTSKHIRNNVKLADTDGG